MKTKKLTTFVRLWMHAFATLQETIATVSVLAKHSFAETTFIIPVLNIITVASKQSTTYKHHKLSDNDLIWCFTQCFAYMCNRRASTDDVHGFMTALRYFYTEAIGTIVAYLCHERSGWCGYHWWSNWSVCVPIAIDTSHGATSDICCWWEALPAHVYMFLY